MKYNSFIMQYVQNKKLPNIFSFPLTPRIRGFLFSAEKEERLRIRLFSLEKIFFWFSICKQNAVNSIVSYLKYLEKSML